MLARLLTTQVFLLRAKNFNRGNYLGDSYTQTESYYKSGKQKIQKYKRWIKKF